MDSLEHISKNLRDVPSSRLVSTQLLISIAMGLSAFLLFCVLRCRFPNIFMARMNYLTASNRKYLPPSIDQRSLFGWIPTIFKINDDEIIQYAGLDAYVFLGFFKMSIKLLTFCLLFSAAVISPVRYYFTGNYDDDNPNSGDHYNGTAIISGSYFNVLRKKKNKDDWNIGIDMERPYLGLYVIFAFVFTYATIYFLFDHANKVIKKRQEILGNQCSVTDRTIKITGVPPELRNERALRNTIDCLGIGKTDKIVICKEWKPLDRLYRQRRYVMEKLETAWAQYLGDTITTHSFNVRPFASSSYALNNREGMYHDNPADANDDGDESIARSDNSQEGAASNTSDGQISDVEAQRSTQNISDFLSLSDSATNYHQRPLVKLGLFGFFGREVDAIDHFTQQLRAIDNEILSARTDHYASTPTALVTMNSVAAAQMLAQAVLDPRINYLITTPAPAPRDIIWENLTMPRKTRAFKQAVITNITGILGFIFVIPVGYLATLLNMKTIRKFWPALGNLLTVHPWAQDLVINLLPVYLYTLLNFIIPYIYVWLSSKQGFLSHGDEELSVVSKNFFYVFVNMFLVFTMAGTASNYWGYLSDSKKLALQLAASLRSLSSFYVDTILLQGMGMHTFKLLLMGQLFRFPFFRAKCKTPRHYLNLYKPPLFNFGLNLPIPMLTLIITLLYSVMSTKILSAGLAYFIIGFYVYKFQLIYSCIHPQHSTGQVMPIIFRRVILGLLLFQLTVAGTLALSNSWVFCLFLAPLPFITLSVWWLFEKNYKPLSYFIALRAIDSSDNSAESATSTGVYSTSSGGVMSSSLNSSSLLNRHFHQLSKKTSTIDERREFNQTYVYPNLVQPLDGPWLAIDNNQVLMASEDGITRKRLLYEEC